MIPPTANSSRFKSLLAWYDSQRRNLPWRRDADPYRVWISEIMLQQTTVAAVIPYYERFLKRFPTVESLAAAGEDEVLKMWAGLGYYARAKNLLKTAREIVTNHNGRFPEELSEALELPGIGRYTAGAILSIAYKQPHPVVDGNVVRVLARLFAIREDVKSPETEKEIWSIAESMLDSARPGDWNQAMMELGATVCKPEHPECERCPLMTDCRAFGLGIQTELPRTSPRQEPVELDWTCLWIERSGNVLLWKRGPKERFLKGHWGLPEDRHIEDAKLGKKIATARHTITHHKIRLELVKAALGGSKVPGSAKWIKKASLDDYLISSVWRKLLPKAA